MSEKKYDSFYDDPWVECTADEARAAHAMERLVRHRGWEDCQTLIHGYALVDSCTLDSLRQLANAKSSDQKDWMWVRCSDSKLLDRK